MDTAHITSLILEYRYWILIPLSFLEGPMIAFVAGTLASLGYFNVYFLAVFFFALDLGKDAVYYGIGHWGARTGYAHRILKKIRVEPEHLEKTREVWEKHPGKTMFFGKLSYGIASSFIMLAGTIGMPLSKFFGWGAVVAILQYGGLLALGYFFGTTFSAGQTSMLTNVLYAIGGITLIASIYYIVTFYIGTRMKKDTEVEK